MKFNEMFTSIIFRSVDVIDKTENQYRYDKRYPHRGCSHKRNCTARVSLF